MILKSNAAFREISKGKRWGGGSQCAKGKVLVGQCPLRAKDKRNPNQKKDPLNGERTRDLTEWEQKKKLKTTVRGYGLLGGKYRENGNRRSQDRRRSKPNEEEKMKLKKSRNINDGIICQRVIQGHGGGEGKRLGNRGKNEACRRPWRHQREKGGPPPLRTYQNENGLAPSPDDWPRFTRISERGGP